MSSSKEEATIVTYDNVSTILQNDTKVKVAGVDVDGILRGKIVAKKKFLSVVRDGFGFCSVVFGWDMHDHTYFRELAISNRENGYRDILAIPDLSTFRRIPWEDDVPFFLVSFFDPDTKEKLVACPRGLMRRMVAKMEHLGYHALAGGIVIFSYYLSVLLLTDPPSCYYLLKLNMNSTNSVLPTILPSRASSRTILSKVYHP